MMPKKQRTRAAWAAAPTLCRSRSWSRGSTSACTTATPATWVPSCRPTAAVRSGLPSTGETKWGKCAASHWSSLAVKREHPTEGTGQTDSSWVAPNPPWKHIIWEATKRCTSSPTARQTAAASSGCAPVRTGTATLKNARTDSSASSAAEKRPWATSACATTQTTTTTATGSEMNWAARNTLIPALRGPVIPASWRKGVKSPWLPRRRAMAVMGEASIEASPFQIENQKQQQQLKAEQQQRIAVAETWSTQQNVLCGNCRSRNCIKEGFHDKSEWQSRAFPKVPNRLCSLSQIKLFCWIHSSHPLWSTCIFIQSTREHSPQQLHSKLYSECITSLIQKIKWLDLFLEKPVSTCLLPVSGKDKHHPPISLFVMSQRILILEYATSYSVCPIIWEHLVFVHFQSGTAKYFGGRL